MLDRFVPFPEQARWMMLRRALNSGVTAELLALRLKKPVRRVRALVMRENQKVRISDMAEWFYAVDGSLVHVDLVPE